MTLWNGPLLPLATLMWPLLLAALTTLPPVRKGSVRLLPVAPLPALWLAVAGGDGVTAVPDLLLGVTLGLDGARRLLLGMTALLWCIAGLAAQPMSGKPNTALFSSFWSLTLAGNLGVFLALDVVTFYVAFAAVSLAAWVLIVHERSATALYAGRVYIVIALAGEVALLVGLIAGADAAGSLAISDVRGALGASGAYSAAIVLLIIGFGIKAGLVPLHVWLPLAHPAAPVPASAVLSGAIVKAGLMGLILFIPEGAFERLLMTLGLAGALGGALWGVTQSNPKAVLAYSTISQMGLMVMLVGAGGAARDTVPYFALHHGFAKGALFLLVGMMFAAKSHRQRAFCLAIATVVSASVAGVPLTGGALAKAAVKQGLPEAGSLALSLSSVATTVILVWFLYRLWHLQYASQTTSWALRLCLPLAAGGLALAGPWLFWPDWTDRSPAYLVATDPLLHALWPVAVALLPAMALLRWSAPELPPGDLLLLNKRWPARLLPVTEPRSLRTEGHRFAGALRWITDRAEANLIRWGLGGLLLPLLVLLIFALLA